MALCQYNPTATSAAEATDDAADATSDAIKATASALRETTMAAKVEMDAINASARALD